MAKKTKTTKTKVRATASPKEYMVVKTSNVTAMSKAYNQGYKRVGTYQQGAVAVLRNPAFVATN